MEKKLRANRLWLAALGILLVPVLVWAFSTGPPAARTGGFGELDCTACHGTSANSGPGSVTVTVPAEYTSGGAFPIQVTVSDASQRRWGFELSARTQGGQQAGTLIPGPDGFTQITGVLAGVQYISHTFAGTRNGTTGGVSFDFNWQAPDVSAGPVVFHVAANAADGDGSNNAGDRIYLTSATVQPQAAPPPPMLPTVGEGGVVNGASFKPQTPDPDPLAPGTIVSVFGTDMTLDGASVFESFFDSNGQLATSLAGAQVTISGVAAPIFAATPGQFNVQVPLEVAGTTSATIQVTVDGQTSESRTFPVGAASPGIFTIPSGGTGAGAITHADGSLVTPQNPAQPGEVVVIFCTGLGAVDPPVETGVRPGLHNTVALPTVTIDGIAATVEFSGMAPGFVGLNQVNVRIPQVNSASNLSLVLTIAGRESNTVTIAVLDPAIDVEDLEDY